MLKLLALALLQSALLAGTQVTLKLSLQQIGAFSWSWAFFFRALTCAWFALCGLCYALSTLLWLYILKHYPLSQAYPLISLSYVMGMLAAVFVFHEAIPLLRWLGVALIMAGVVMVSMK